MRYMLLVHADEAAIAAASPAENERRMSAYLAYAQALRAGGLLVSSDRLRPTSTATTIRVVDGRTQVLDGPYAESKEQLGGYFIIDVPDLDAALSWAARCPAASAGAVEVRPVWAN